MKNVANSENKVELFRQYLKQKSIFKLYKMLKNIFNEELLSRTNSKRKKNKKK